MIKTLLKTLAFGAAVAGTSVTGGMAEAATTRPMNEIDPSGTSTNIVSNWGRGYQFTVDAPNLFVQELGYVTPAGGNFAIALWDLLTSTRVAFVDGLSGTTSPTGWEFAPVAAVDLVEGRDYAVTLYGIGTQTYYYTDDAAYRPSGDIDYVTMLYCNNCAPTALPATVLPGYNYGLVDIGYTAGASTPQVPLPAGLPLMLGAGAALAALKIRRKG